MQAHHRLSRIVLVISLAGNVALSFVIARALLGPIPESSRKRTPRSGKVIHVEQRSIVAPPARPTHAAGPQSSRVFATPDQPAVPLNSPSSIAMKMMEQGFPEDLIVTVVNGAILRRTEREQIAGMLHAGKRLNRWHQALSADKETSNALQDKLRVEYESAYREIVGAMSPEARSRFDESALGRALHRFEQAK